MPFLGRTHIHNLSQRNKFKHVACNCTSARTKWTKMSQWRNQQHHSATYHMPISPTRASTQKNSKRRTQKRKTRQWNERSPCWDSRSCSNRTPQLRSDSHRRRRTRAQLKANGRSTGDGNQILRILSSPSAANILRGKRFQVVSP